MLKVMSVFGTRPEAIKMAPVVQALETCPDIDSRVCVTAQHREMLDQVLRLFDIHPQYDMDLMKQGQTLYSITTGVLQGLEPILEAEKPDLLLYIASRAVLDKCADVDEAVALLSGYDIYSPSRFSYHLFLTDKSGKAVTVEWLENGQTVVEDNAVTNFVLFEAPPTRDPDGRYYKLRNALDAEEGVPTRDKAMEVLETVSSKEGTRWSAVYDLDDFEVRACFNADYENIYEFKGTE